MTILHNTDNNSRFKVLVKTFLIPVFIGILCFANRLTVTCGFSLLISRIHFFGMMLSLGSYCLRGKLKPESRSFMQNSECSEIEGACVFSSNVWVMWGIFLWELNQWRPMILLLHFKFFFWQGFGDFNFFLKKTSVVSICSLLSVGYT